MSNPYAMDYQNLCAAYEVLVKELAELRVKVQLLEQQLDAANTTKQ